MEPGELQYMGVTRVSHDRVTDTFTGYSHSIPKYSEYMSICNYYVLHMKHN